MLINNTGLHLHKILTNQLLLTTQQKEIITILDSNQFL